MAVTTPFLQSAMMPNEARIAEKDPRVYLAAERTLLSWIRTGLALMGFGFVVARFGLFLRELEAARGPVNQSPHGSLWFGTGLVLMGVIVNIVAAIQHTRYVKRLQDGTWSPDRQSRSGAILAVALAVSGVVITAYLLVIR